jgi:hypothetical protein
MVFARTETIEALARRKLQRPSQIGLLVRTRRQDLFLRPLPHPACANLRQEGEIECIRTHPHLMGLQMLVRKPKTRQTLNPVRIVIFGDQYSAFPHPAHLVEPVAHRFR